MPDFRVYGLLLYTHMQIHAERNDDAIKTSRHSSLEKYTSHFIQKGCM